MTVRWSDIVGHIKQEQYEGSVKKI